MNIQNQIKRTLSQSESIEYIQYRLKCIGDMGRTELAEELCEYFDFFAPNGQRQVFGCLKALRKLEKEGWFVLPATRSVKPGKKMGQKRLNEPVAQSLPLPEEAGKIQRLRLILVETQEQRCLWNELMIRDHPQGEKPLVGRQLRYLIQSEHGWLGGVGFGAAALHLQARDRWIGWDWQGRQERLESVVSLSRLLIREGVKCKNLASRVLGMVVRQLPKDFQARYGYQPLLVESFIDSPHQGTSYKAANWQWLGQTKGRGRQDQMRQAGESIKDIYVYPLVADFRVRLGLAADAGLGEQALHESLQGENWAEKEFGGAPLGDRRLSQRLVEIGSNKADNPGRSYSDAVQGDVPKMKAYYRFIEQPDQSAVTTANILLPHREQTIRRMKAEKRVLCVQDGTDLNYSHLAHCSGLGNIGTNQTGATSAGLHLHSTLALTTEGLPLGVLQGQFTAPIFASEKEQKKSTEIPIEEKKTFCWIEGLRDCRHLKAQMPHTSIISVMDREADFYELFDEQRRQGPRVELLVRAKYDRVLMGEEKLFETVRQSPVREQYEIAVPRESARPKKSKQKAREKRPARVAKVSLRYQQVELQPGKNHKDKEPVSLWVVHVREQRAPQSGKRLEWFLLTTMKVESTQDALDCVNWYKLRWRIEDWHRVLKSGCGSEKLAFETAERLITQSEQAI